MQGPGFGKKSVPNNVLFQDGGTEAPAPSSPVATGKSGLKYKYYEGDIRQVSDISKQKVKKQGTLSNFSLSPMQRKYYFGFEYEGYIKIEKAGEYYFLHHL